MILIIIVISGDLKKLIITQNLVQDFELTLVWETYNKWNNNDETVDHECDDNTNRK